MSTANKKSLITLLISTALTVNHVFADNAVTCDTANGGIENTAITASTAHLTDNEDGTISDSQTGLVWKKCSEGQVSFNDTISTGGGAVLFLGVKCSGVADTYTWQDALQRAQDVNTGTGQNYSQTDWRLPNIKELASIAEQRCRNPGINNTLFPITLPSSGLAFYLSSSSFEPLEPDSGKAWFVNFNLGIVGRGSKNNSGFSHVRLVRSGQ